MDNNKILIIALIVIIVALLVGLVAMMPNTNKQDTKLTFKSNATLKEGGSLQMMLTDANGTAISNQTVNVTITDKDNSSDYHSVVTNAEGIGSLNIDKSAGEYEITVSYGGNEQYNGCNATKKITIEEKEEVVEPEVTSSSGSSSYNQPHTYPSGLTDAEIEAYIQRDLDTRAQNGIGGEYNYADARDFYENCPPSGPV